MSDEELKQLIASNAKAIQAFSTSISDLKGEWQKDRQEWQKDRSRLYSSMAHLSETVAQVAAAQASFWEVQADYYRRLDEMDRRQGDIIKILDRLTEDKGV